MAYHAYDEIKRKLQRKEEFRGNTMWARWEVPIKSNVDTYIVYSYATPIAWWNPGMDKPLVNLGKYSRTTSYHQNLVKAHLHHGEYEEKD